MRKGVQNKLSLGALDETSLTTGKVYAGPRKYRESKDRLPHLQRKQGLPFFWGNVLLLGSLNKIVPGLEEVSILRYFPNC